MIEHGTSATTMLSASLTGRLVDVVICLVILHTTICAGVYQTVEMSYAASKRFLAKLGPLLRFVVALTG